MNSKKQEINSDVKSVKVDFTEVKFELSLEKQVRHIAYLTFKSLESTKWEYCANDLQGHHLPAYGNSSDIL